MKPFFRRIFGTSNLVNWMVELILFGAATVNLVVLDRLDTFFFCLVAMVFKLETILIQAEEDLLLEMTKKTPRTPDADCRKSPRVRRAAISHKQPERTATCTTSTA